MMLLKYDDSATSQQNCTLHFYIYLFYCIMSFNGRFVEEKALIHQKCGVVWCGFFFLIHILGMINGNRVRLSEALDDYK